MRHTTAVFCLLLLAGLVAADCRTGFDYCMNLTLPLNQTNKYDLELRDANFGDNMDGVAYVDADLGNIYAVVDNTTDTTNGLTWEGPYLIGLIGGGNDLRVVPNDPCVNCINGSYLTICVNGTYTNSLIADPTGAEGNTIRSLKLSEFTQYYRRNWTFRHEGNKSVFGFTGQNATLTGWCNTLTEFEINLTSEVGGGGSITVITEEKPKYFLDYNNLPTRIRQDNVNFLKDDYYLLASTTDASQYTFTLQDYTGGQFYKSTLNIQRSINDSFGNIHVEEFPQDNIIYPFLKNRTQYKLILKSQDMLHTRDLGQYFIEDNALTRDILITRPDLGEFPFSWDDTNIDITTNWAAKQIGCNVNTTVTTTGYFEVFNYSTADDTLSLDYITSSSGKDIAFTHTVADQNGTFWAHCAVNDTTNGLRQGSVLVNLRNETLIFKEFNLDIPTTLIGLSRAFVYKLISLVVIIIIFNLFSQDNFGTGAVVSAAFVVLFDFIGWLPTPNFLTSTIVFLAVFIKLSQRRRGIAT